MYLADTSWLYSGDGEGGPRSYISSRWLLYLADAGWLYGGDGEGGGEGHDAQLSQERPQHHRSSAITCNIIILALFYCFTM